MRLAREWRAALPYILKLSAVLWSAGVVVALVRGLNTADPLEIARRLLIGALISILSAVTMVVAVQGAVFLVGSAARHRRKR